MLSSTEFMPFDECSRDTSANGRSNVFSLMAKSSNAMMRISPLPSVLLNEPRPTKRPLHAVVGINDAERILVLITAYEPDPRQWTEHFSRRVV